MKNFNKFWTKYGILMILVFLVAILGILSPNYFLTKSNLIQVFLQSSITIVVACGEFFTILIAGIDLSVGSVMALVGIIAGKLLLIGINPLVVIFLSLIFGIILGLINGFLVNKTGLHPFIITLGTQSIFRGITLIISDARSVFGFPLSFNQGLAGYLGPIPIPVIIALSLSGILAFFTNYCKAGRNIYALGGNKTSAWYSGINVKLYTLIVFMISGFCSGLGGILTAARLGAAEPLTGVGFESTAIAATIIGGTSFFGGKGKISGVIVGGLIIGVIGNGMNILSISTFYQQIVMGSLIIVSVFFDRLVGLLKSNK